MLTYARTSSPASRARTTVGSNIANCSSRLRLRLRCAKVSVALPKIAMWRQPSSRARSSPRSFGTSTGSSLPASPSSPSISIVISSAASASWGTHFGCTKLVASTTGRPTASRRWMNSAFASTGTMPCSFCRPSRGPTS